MEDKLLKIKAFAVIDTNVLFSVLYSKTKNTYPYKIAKFVESENIIPIFDKDMLIEYYDVLNRDNRFDSKDISDLLLMIVEKGILVKQVSEVSEVFKDRDDIPFFEVMESFSEDEPAYLITGNIKDFPNSPDRIVDCHSMCVILEQLDRFLSKDTNYIDAFVSIFNKLMKDFKYELGKNIIENHSNNISISDTFNNIPDTIRVPRRR